VNNLAIVLTQVRDINVTSSNKIKGDGDMSDYKDVLKFLAANPPKVDSEKMLYASILERLAMKLRCKKEGVDQDYTEVFLNMPDKPAYKKGYH
jgi:hypothetical protein